MGMPTMQQPVDSESLNSGLVGFVALACIALMAFGAVFTARLGVAAYRVTTWPTTEGTVSATPNKTTPYSYRYTAQEGNYLSDVASFSVDLTEGETVTVYYNPNNPNESVIGQTATSSTFLGAPLLLAIGAGGLLWLVRKTSG